MPKILDAEGFRFFFYSNEHPPIHVHVRYAEGEAVFILEPDVELRESVAFNVRRLSRAEELIHEHIELIKQAWHEHLG
jgi:hypothetical protein